MSEKKQEKAQEKAPANKLNIVIIILLVLIIAGMVGIVGGYFLLVKGKTTTANTTEVTVTSAQENTYTLDEFTINLSDTDSQKYINAQVSLGYDESQTKLKSELESTEVVKKPILSDAVISVIRNKKASDFQGAGLEKVKQEIIDAVNPDLSKGKILHVYFSKLVIQ